MFIKEALGTMIMIILLEGAIAGAVLNKSAMRGMGTFPITIAHGLALLIPCWIFGTESGTYYNSALTLALAIDGTLKFGQAATYIGAQFVGAFVGAIIVYITFHDQFDATEDPGTKLGVFSTCCSIPNYPRNFFNELLATFILVLVVKGIGANAEPQTQKYLVSAAMSAIMLSLGGVTGCAMNPIRDLAPRFAHAFLPIKGKGSSNWGYSLIPVIGPTVGAIAAVLLAGVIFG